MVQGDDESARIQGLLAPLIADKSAWESSFTEEEKAKGQQFEEEIKTNPEALKAFMGQINEAFVFADANSDGLLNREEFKVFVETMNNHGVARGLKHRDTTDEFISSVYPSFNGFNTAADGVTC